MALSLSSKPAGTTTATPASREEMLIWNRLGQGPRSLLDAEEIANLFEPSLPQPLRSALAERLGMQEERALAPCLRLIERYGPHPELLMALGMTHQPGARDKLFGFLGDSSVDRAALLCSLACWGRQVKLEVILDALQHPAENMRLAGLELLHFHARLLKSSILLQICEDLLNDFRPRVPIATIRLLQRRNEAIIAERLARLVNPGAQHAVCDAAIQALGCIGTEASVTLLLSNWLSCRGTGLAEALTQQLGAQFRYRNVLLQQLANLHQQGVVSAAEIEPLCLTLQPTQAIGVTSPHCS